LWFLHGQNAQIDIFHELFFAELITPESVSYSSEPALEKSSQHLHGLLGRNDTHVIHYSERAKSAEPTLAWSHAQAGPVLDIADISCTGLVYNPLHFISVNQFTFADNIFHIRQPLGKRITA
jgi:hypothetical protein